MYKNHLKIAFRHLTKNKFFAGINILGLALGMTLAILIACFVKEEHSYDHWLKDSERTYRIYRSWGDGGTIWTPPPLVGKLNTDYPQIQQAAALGIAGEQLLQYDNQSFYVENTMQVDSTFFEVLKVPFLQGSPTTALDQPDNMVITDRLAKKIFGDQKDILGKVLTIDGHEEVTITGILNTEGNKIHFQSDLYTQFSETGTFWTGNNRYAYVTLQPTTDVGALENLLTRDLTKLLKQEYESINYTPKPDEIPSWKLQPLQEVYLKSENIYTYGVSEGSLTQIYILLGIGLLVLLVAIINYINLTTARASQRSKEVGVKKVTGASNGLLRMQFLTESVLQALIAGTFAIFIAQLALPIFNTVTGSSFSLLNNNLLLIIGGVLLLSLLIGLLAGIYPAFVLTSYQPVSALKANFSTTGKKGLFRKVLVTGQFVVTITLLIVMAFIYRQVQYMTNQELGLSVDQVITIPMNNSESHRKVEQLKSRFLQIPGVSTISNASFYPGTSLPDWGLLVEGQTEAHNPFVIFSDEGYQKTLDIELVAGRFIKDKISADSSSNYVVNETFVKEYGIDNPLETRIRFMQDSTYGQIVGVMKDFHFQGLHREIRPIVMNALHWRNYVGIKVSPKNLPTTLAAIEQLWASIEPLHPMRYEFLDAEFAKQYASHRQFGETILYATLLTLFIAFLGLIGLTAFSLERRTKEIGIRKVLGASVAGIVGLLAKDYVRLAVMASIIAIPIGYYLSNKWLEDFAHRTDLVWWIFLLAGGTIILLGFLIVCFQSMRSALVNPINSLRDE